MRISREFSSNPAITHSLRMHFQLFEIVANEKLICKMLIKRCQLVVGRWSDLHSNSSKLQMSIANGSK